MPNVLRYRGIEAWLENSNGLPIALSEDAIDSSNISTWVNITPRQFFTLRWRTSAGRKPISALCNVYIKDGFHSVELESSNSELCVSTSIMDAERRISQSKTTKGWLNPPYNRFGCLRIRRRIVQTDRDSTKKLKTQPDILLLGSVRLEIRRVSGLIHNDQVYWGKGDDGMGICVFNPYGIKVIDDAERGEPPWIVFEFKFREDPKMTQHITEENRDTDTKIGVRNHLETTQKSSKSGTLALPAIGRAKGIPDVTPSIGLGPSTHTSSLPLLRGEIPKTNVIQCNKTGLKYHMKSQKSKSGKLALPTAEDPRIAPSIGPSTHTSTSSQPQATRERNKIGWNQLKFQKLKSGHGTTSRLALPAAEDPGIPDVASSIRPSTNTSLLPQAPSLVPRRGGKFVPNANLKAPDSGPNVAVAASQRKVVAHPPSSPPTTTKDIFHTEMILSTESAMPTSEPSPPPMDRTTAANPGTQIGRSDGGLHGQRPGVLLSEGMATGFSHSRNSPTTRETDSRIQTPLTVCEPGMAPQINEVQSSEGCDRTLVVSPPTNSSEIVNAAPDINMTSNLDLDGREQFVPNPADSEVVLENSPDTVELSTSRKGKRKMIDRGGDTNASAHLPAGDGGLKRYRITTVAEEDDIEYIGSWRPGKTRTKNIIVQTAASVNLPIKLENPVNDSDPLPPTAVKSQEVDIKIKFEDELDHEMPIDEMMGNYDALERQKKELKKKLAVKMEVQQREIDELLRRLDD